MRKILNNIFTWFGMSLWTISILSFLYMSYAYDLKMQMPMMPKKVKSFIRSIK
jgi:uncharacterized membrane protein YukC